MDSNLDIFLDDEFDSQQSCVRILDSDGMIGQRVTVTTEVNTLRIHNSAISLNGFSGHFFEDYITQP